MTMTELTKTIDVTTDGEYAEHDEVKIVMTTAQALALRAALTSGTALDPRSPMLVALAEALTVLDN